MITLLLAAQIALADIPPPADYVETCTVAKQCGPEEIGATCTATYEGREACEPLEAQGYIAKCSTHGATVRTEVLCRPRTAEDPAPEAPEAAEAPPPAAPSQARCATPIGGAAGMALLFPALLLLRRR